MEARLLRTGYARTLSQLRSAGDRSGFHALADSLAADHPLASLRFCFVEARPEDLALLADEDHVVVRPCFGRHGTSIRVRTEEGLEALFQVGADLGPGIVRLVINPGIGRSGLAPLLERLPLDDLDSLRIEGNDIRCRSVYVQREGKVIHLEIDGDDRVLRALARLPLLDLRLCENRLGPAGCKVLRTMHRLERLDLRANGIGDAGLFALATLPLKALRVESNGITSAGLHALRDGPISDLDLARNPIGVEGARILSSLPLRRLRVDACGLGDAGAEALCALEGEVQLSCQNNDLSEEMKQRLRTLFDAPRL